MSPKAESSDLLLGYCCVLYPQALCLDKQILGFFGKHFSSADHSCAVCLADDSLLLYVHLSHEMREVSAFHSGVPEMLWSAGGSSPCTLYFNTKLLFCPENALEKVGQEDKYLFLKTAKFLGFSAPQFCIVC